MGAKKKEIAKVKKAEIVQIGGANALDEKTLRQWLIGIKNADKLSESQQNLFIRIAMRFKLDPFAREVHAIPRAVKELNEKTGRYEETGEYSLSIVTGYETYLRRAEDSQRYDGYKTSFKGSLGDPKNFSCAIQVFRKDLKHPIEHEVWFEEYAQYYFDKKAQMQKLMGLWKTKPRTMLRKVAISQGFRLAFSKELQGMPYIIEELNEDYIPRDEAKKVLDNVTKKIEDHTEKEKKKKEPEVVKDTQADRIKKQQMDYIKQKEKELAKKDSDFTDKEFMRIRLLGTKKGTKAGTSEDMSNEERARWIKFLDEEIRMRKEPE